LSTFVYLRYVGGLILPDCLYSHCTEFSLYCAHGAVVKKGNVHQAHNKPHETSQYCTVQCSPFNVQYSTCCQLCLAPFIMPSRLESVAEVWWDVHRDAAMRRSSGNPGIWGLSLREHAAVGEKRFLGVIHPCDRRGEYQDTRADRLGSVIYSTVTYSKHE
jgi:hypothetical protein